MNAVLQDQPLPARLVPWPRSPSTTLQRCLLLAALLHVWLVVWLGSAPGGTAQPGRGVWGAINVTLRGPVSEGSAAAVLPALPSSTAPGEAATPRWGGAVREATPLPDSLPGAAQLGLPSAQRPEAKADASVATLPTPPTVTATPAATDSAAPAVASALTGEAQAISAPAAPPARSPDRATAGPAPPQTRAFDPALARAAPRSEPSLASAAPQQPALALPVVPVPAAAVDALPRQLTSPLAMPAARSAAAPLAPTAAVPALPELAAPSAPGAAPSALRQLRPGMPADGRAAQPALATSPQAETLPLPSPPAVAGAPLPAVGAAAADADTRAGHDVATPPAAPASAPPRLNLQLARPRGGELSRHDSRGVLPVLPRPPERDDKLARDIDKAARTDCRSAYSALGPLAVIPLAVDAVRKDGACKW